MPPECNGNTDLELSMWQSKWLSAGRNRIDPHTDQQQRLENNWNCLWQSSIHLSIDELLLRHLNHQENDIL